MPLTDLKIKTAKPQEKPFKLSDGDGLCIIVRPSGKKWWRFRYRFNGKEQSLSFGTYPEISLMKAREKRLEARSQVAAGINPSSTRKAEAEETRDTFENVAREWHEKFISIWTPLYASTILRRLERDIFPMIGNKPIRNLTSPEILAALRLIESRGTFETAHRVKTICGQVFRYAIASGKCEIDPTVALRDALAPCDNTKHFAALTDLDDLAGLLRAIDGYQGTPTVRAALQLAPLIFVRPGELRNAEWAV